MHTINLSVINQGTKEYIHCWKSLANELFPGWIPTSLSMHIKAVCSDKSRSLSDKYDYSFSIALSSDEFYSFSSLITQATVAGARIV